ncbi:1210_t:CDS:2, partial [Dentiscutata erythropus]
VLKYGSYIVDALTNYKQPVFVYIIPNGELRGGAWVVIDPSINENMMEMYADKKSRAGVLEPEGVVEIKYRKPQILETMERLDETYPREQELLPVYSQIALQFAELHDTPGRMKAKNTIRKVLEWKQARRYFYWRVRLRLHEEYIFRKIHEANSNLTRSQMKSYLVEWFRNDMKIEYDWEESDIEVVKWFDKILSEDMNDKNNDNSEFTETFPSIKSRIEKIRDEAITKNVIHLGKRNQKAVFEGISELFKDL